MVRCPSCGGSYVSLATHFGMVPECDPLNVAPVPPPPQLGSSAQPQRDSPTEKMMAFEQHFTHKVMHDYNGMRFQKFINTAACDTCHAKSATTS